MTARLRHRKRTEKKREGKGGRGGGSERIGREVLALVRGESFMFLTLEKEKERLVRLLREKVMGEGGRVTPP